MLEPSFFDIFQQSLSGTNHEKVLSRIIRLSRVKQGFDPAKAAEKHKKIVEGLLVNNGGDVTGLLMIQGDFVLHILETTSSNMKLYLRDVLDDTSLISCEIDNRILCVIEDFPERMFHEWYSLLLQEKHDQTFNLADYDIVDVVDKILFDLEQAPIKIDEGNHVIHFDGYLPVSPSIELLQALLSSNEFMTDMDFMSSILSVINDDHLVSNQVWPLESRPATWLSTATTTT